jgi:DNA polymerase-3 subunit epsilon/CBS domain-containing protein
MVAVSNATPLVALDAVVIDTETTGLDAASAWIVEVAAVRLSAGQLDMDAPLRRLVRPGVPIPRATSQIHGIDDAAVADAPDFARVAADVAAAIDGAVVIGHTLAFDLAVLAREFARAGRAWVPPRALDTGLLAEVAAPGLAGYSLDSLASWLGVTIHRRHSALGDAEAAGRIFLALLPRLRSAGIRTLAEAEFACRAMTDHPGAPSRAGWAQPTAAAVSPMAGAAPIDSEPYRHRVSTAMTTPPLFTLPDVPMRAALARMTGERVSSLFVHPGEGARPVWPGDVGIVTERDVMRALARDGGAALDHPVSDVASRPLHAVPADALAFLAVARMNRLGIRHLGVTDEQGHVIGALSARDLLRVRGEGAISLGDEIDDAQSVPELARAWSGLPHVAAALLADDMSARQVAAVISTQVHSLTARAAVLAEQRMRDAGQGGPPCPYAFAVLGSAGRGESLLAMDQDNALVFQDGPANGPADAWFRQLATHVTDILNEVGVPYCKGGVMARHAPWRASVEVWRERIAHWIARSSPQDLLAVDIFFDMLGVHGDVALSNSIWRAAFDAAAGQVGFAKLLIDTAGAVEPGFTFLRTFRTTAGRMDLKRSGLFGLVSAVRAVAICRRVVERATPARLAGIKALKIGGERDIDALDEAHKTFLDLLLRQQIDDMERGIPPSNAVLVTRLARRDRERLRDALDAVAHLEELTRALLFKG